MISLNKNKIPLQKLKKINLKTTINNKFLSATILHKGAELCSLIKNSSKTEYIWEGNAAHWGKHSPVLFPIVGTLKNNKYSFNNVEYQLSRHGFARDLDFKLIEKQENKAVFSLKSTLETQKVYPFEFELQLSYEIINSTLIVAYEVFNNSNDNLPFSIGAHPAFALPNKFGNYSLQFEKQENLNCFTLENDLLSDNNYDIELKNKQLLLNYQLFENDALIFKTLKSKNITILENEKPTLKISFEDFKNLGIWTKINAPFICLEPWLGYSDTTNHNGIILAKDGIQFATKEKSNKYSFSIEILT